MHGVRCWASFDPPTLIALIRQVYWNNGCQVSPFFGALPRSLPSTVHPLSQTSLLPTSHPNPSPTTHPTPHPTQIIPPLDSGIAAAIEANLDLWDLSKVDLEAAARSGLLTDPLPVVTAAYFERLKEQVNFCGAKENVASEPVVYTPLVRACCCRLLVMGSVSRCFCCFC